MKGKQKAKTIAEFCIYRWLEYNNFVLSEFNIEFNKNEAVIADKHGEILVLVYENGNVHEKEF